jgi:hypothetical protein
VLCLLFFLSCGSSSTRRAKKINAGKQLQQSIVSTTKFDEKSWPYFLQHLSVKDAPILDYTGKPVSYQQKHTVIVEYDVGNKDLQQCADALMRLRAEYLFQQQRYSEIGFHFVSGQYYSWNDYCKGLRPVPEGTKVQFITTASSDKTHETLRKYLDIVYNYASTISLAKELKKVNDFTVGTVIIHPGSPGHCCIIVDEATDKSGEKVFKIVEGYSPAQSIYVLRNIWANGVSPWYKLGKGEIITASFEFKDYKLGIF